jgi:3-hydroxybutyryl-CoA dehydratase
VFQPVACFVIDLSCVRATDVGAGHLQPGAIDRLEFRIGPEDMQAFRRLSGDTNPIHHDPVYARQRGFDDVVVYGGLIVAQVSRLLGTAMPGPGCVWRSIALRFRHPLYVDIPARVQATVAYANETFGLVKLKLRVEAGGVVVADGEAEAQLSGKIKAFDARVRHATA